MSHFGFLVQLERFGERQGGGRTKADNEGRKTTGSALNFARFNCRRNLHKHTGLLTQEGD